MSPVCNRREGREGLRLDTSGRAIPNRLPGDTRFFAIVARSALLLNRLPGDTQNAGNQTGVHALLNRLPGDTPGSHQRADTT